MLNHVFYAEKNVFRDIYYYPNRSENGDGHIQELCIYTALICNDIFFVYLPKNIP